MTPPCMWTPLYCTYPLLTILKIALFSALIFGHERGFAFIYVRSFRSFSLDLVSKLSNLELLQDAF